VRVLIAEDELVLAHVMRVQLQRKGLDVVGLAANGRVAVERCRELNPELVLMDVRMPGTDGVEATRLIMGTCPTCVIIVTAYADDGTVCRAEAAGAMGFLSKPVQAAGVLEEVPKACARFGEFETIRAESPSLEEALATRVLVEAAKRSLIHDRGIAPEDAFGALQRMAKEAGLSLRAIAERIAGSGPADQQRPI
jgi:AmiR/NasT family two-component response regulator